MTGEAQKQMEKLFREKWDSEQLRRLVFPSQTSSQQLRYLNAQKQFILSDNNKDTAGPKPLDLAVSVTPSSRFNHSMYRSLFLIQLPASVACSVVA